MQRIGASLYDHPAAARTRAAYEAALAEGFPPTEASRLALRDVADALLDDRDRPMVYAALAAAQLADGRIEEWLKVIVLASLLNGEVRLEAPLPGFPTDPAVELLRDRLLKT